MCSSAHEIHEKKAGAEESIYFNFQKKIRNKKIDFGVRGRDSGAERPAVEISYLLNSGKVILFFAGAPGKSDYRPNGTYRGIENQWSIMTMIFINTNIFSGLS
ncbi:MAG TPA: hypothetical protein O0X66_00655 [Methanocorpusculum sp.]|nr:hypothetical protein [Methanocorpusculum sp.]HJJ53002.1 hypothetical protein [Methanocorpusculum sp.]